MIISSTRMIFWGAVLAGLAVALGAFGAHGLKEVLEPQQMEVYKTGVQYHFLHALAMILCGVLYRQHAARYIRSASLAFMLGIILFSGSLYLISIAYLKHTDMKWLGAITPLGGIFFLVGWTLLASCYWKKTAH